MELLYHGDTRGRTDGHNRLSAFGVIGTSSAEEEAPSSTLSHNRLSAFGVIGTKQDEGETMKGYKVTIAFRLLG